MRLFGFRSSAGLLSHGQTPPSPSASSSQAPSPRTPADTERGLLPGQSSSEGEGAHTVILYQLARTTFHDNHRDRRALLRLRAFVVGGHTLEVLGDRAVAFVELEGVRQGHARELDVALVHALLGAHLVVHLLDVDRRDVVGQQHELVREDVILVLVFQGLGRDEAQLQQASHEGARPREGLDDRDPRIPQTLAKGCAHRIVGAADDEIHDLDGREDDAQALAHAREGLREETIVERAHDLLLARQGVHGLDALDHRPVEGIQLAVFVLDHRMIGEHLKDRVHRVAHRVLLRE